MATASGRYQSRFFNFIHQQSRRISEQCDRAVRQIRYATSWIAPAVVYPFSLLFQSKRIGQASSQQNAPQLNASHPAASTVDVDTPIQNVLESVVSPPPTPKENRFFAWFAPQALIRFVTARGELATTPPAPLILQESQRSVVRGIATQLTTRTLVLVTATNQTLDVLTPPQQQTLQATILHEVAAYWRYQRLLHAASAQLLSSVESPQPLAYIDQSLAQIEAHYVNSVSKVAIAIQHWQPSNHSISTPTPTPADVEHRNFQHHALNLQTLIWAAIDFFFGSRSSNQLEAESQQSPQLSAPSNRKIFPHRHVAQLSASATASSTIEDPWLTWGDLFGNSQEATTQLTAEDQTQKVLPENTSLSLHTKLRRWRKFQPKVAIPALVKGNQQDQARAIASTNSARLQLNDTIVDPPQINPASDWIDISATTMGYVKHPLEQILAWLDRAMLWLEEAVFKMWRWLSRFALKRTQ